jgi:transcriptional regulator NrdR family protein
VTSTYQNETGITKRRRECYDCQYRFTTRERPEREGVELAEGWINRHRIERAKPIRKSED